jgi:hypothetical protein
MHNIKFRYTKNKKHTKKHTKKYTKTKKNTKNTISIGGFQQSQSPISNQQRLYNMIYKLLQKQKLLQTQQTQPQHKKNNYNFRSKNSLAVRGQLTGTM